MFIILNLLILINKICNLTICNKVKIKKNYIDKFFFL